MKETLNLDSISDIAELDPGTSTIMRNDILKEDFKREITHGICGVARVTDADSGEHLLRWKASSGRQFVTNDPHPTRNWNYR